MRDASATPNASCAASTVASANNVKFVERQKEEFPENSLRILRGSAPPMSHSRARSFRSRGAARSKPRPDGDEGRRPHRLHPRCCAR